MDNDNNIWVEYDTWDRYAFRIVNGKDMPELNSS
jgi:hypothetical protein